MKMEVAVRKRRVHLSRSSRIYLMASGALIGVMLTTLGIGRRSPLFSCCTWRSQWVSHGQLHASRSLSPDVDGQARLTGVELTPESAGEYGLQPEVAGDEPGLASRARVEESYGHVPLSFEPNRGQTDRTVRFLSHGNGFGLFLRATEAVLALASGPPAQAFPSGKAASRRGLLRMKLLGANAAPRIQGVGRLPGDVNYFVGNNPRNWRSRIPTYEKVVERGVYDGIDLVYYGIQGQLEYDFIVKPGADPARISLAIDGARKLSVDGRGDLVLSPDGGEVLFHKPVVYQETPGTTTRREYLEGRFVLRSAMEVGFTVHAYDKSRPLVIDPVASFSTYLGGSALDVGEGVAVDSQGNAYVAGYTFSQNFPVTKGAYSPNECCAFVTKLDPTGKHLLYSTLFGISGPGGAVASAIAVDSNGSAYITGQTGGGLPVTTGAYQKTFGGGTMDAFVTKFNATGSALVYSTYLGGSDKDQAWSIAVDSAGNAYVTGATLSTNYPTTTGALDSKCGSDGKCNLGQYSDAFVTELNPAGTALVYSTYLGGSERDVGYGIAVTPSGRVLVTGQTNSTDFPATSGAYQTTYGGGINAFVAAFSTGQKGAASLLFSTYLGGNSLNVGTAISSDSAGSAYVTGIAGADFPVTPGAFQAHFGGSTSDAFVAKVSIDGSRLIYSTFLGGSQTEQGSGIAVDRYGAVYVVGQTTSPDFPTAYPLQSQSAKSQDAFIAKLDASGSRLLFSSYLGGSGVDAGLAIATGPCGTAYAAGQTFSSDFPASPGAFMTTTGGGSDAFVVKLLLTPVSALWPSRLVFPPQRWRTTSAPQVVTVTNQSMVALHFVSFSVRGDFAETDNCGSSLAPGQSCSINVTFTPVAMGLRTGWVLLQNDAACGGKLVVLSGTGVLGH